MQNGLISDLPGHPSLPAVTSRIPRRKTNADADDHVPGQLVPDPHGGVGVDGLGSDSRQPQIS
jgi:hypothetical protein